MLEIFFSFEHNCLLKKFPDSQLYDYKNNNEKSLFGDL